MATLYTVGHGTSGREEFSELLRDTGIGELVDVRSVPASRRNPHFARAAMEAWVPEAGIAYRWEPELGGFRRPALDSPHTAIRHPAFRGYADYMMSDQFRDAAAKLYQDASKHTVAIMCAETLWWKCHRRLLSDAVVLMCGGTVLHIVRAGNTAPHRVTEGVRLGSDGILYYDGGQLALEVET